MTTPNWVYETSDRLTKRWALNPKELYEIRTAGGYVFSDGEKVIKIPKNRQSGLEEVDGLSRYSSYVLVPNVLAVDDLSGAYLMNFLIGKHPYVIDHLTTIRNALNPLINVSVPVGSISAPWPRHPESKSTYFDRLISEIYSMIPWDCEDLRQSVYRHGDLWHNNIFLFEDQSVMFLDPIPAVGPSLYDIADLTARAVVFQHDGHSSEVFGCVADTFGTDRNLLAMLTKLSIIMSAARCHARGNLERMNLNQTALDLLRI